MIKFNSKNFPQTHELINRLPCVDNIYALNDCQEDQLKRQLFDECARRHPDFTMDFNDGLEYEIMRGLRILSDEDQAQKLMDVARIVMGRIYDHYFYGIDDYINHLRNMEARDTDRSTYGYHPALDNLRQLARAKKWEGFPHAK